MKDILQQAANDIEILKTISAQPLGMVTYNCLASSNTMAQLCAELQQAREALVVKDQEYAALKAQSELTVTAKDAEIDALKTPADSFKNNAA